MKNMYIAEHGEWSDKYDRYVYPAFTDRDTHDDIAAGIENRWHAVEYVRDGNVWRAIESAPLDGSFIDVCDDKGDRYVDVWCEKGTWMNVEGDYAEPLGFKPSYWMPRPKPPHGV